MAGFLTLLSASKKCVVCGEKSEEKSTVLFPQNIPSFNPKIFILSMVLCCLLVCFSTDQSTLRFINVVVNGFVWH